MLIPWLVFLHKRKKYSVPVRAAITDKHVFEWFDSDHRTHPGMQLTYRYEMNGVSYTWRGRPIHHVKDVPEIGSVMLYVNPADETDVWEDRDRQDLWISMGVGIAFIIGGCAATMIYFGLI